MQSLASMQRCVVPLGKAPAPLFTKKMLTTSRPLSSVPRFTPSQPSHTPKRQSVVVAATEASYDEGLAGKNDYAPIISVAGFVAVWFNKLQVDRVKLLQALAILTLFTTAVNLLLNRGVGDGISHVVSPAVLAIAVLNVRHANYLDASTAMFGYYLSLSLEGLTGLPFYAYLATLAVALYTGYGTLWYVGAFGIAAAAKVYKSTNNSEPLPVLVIPGILAAAFAIWKEAHFPLALCLYLGQVVWSGLKAVDALTKKVEKEAN